MNFNVTYLFISLKKTKATKINKKFKDRTFSYNEKHCRTKEK